MPSPVSRWKAPRSRGIQKKDKKGSGAPVGASEPLFTIGAVTATSQFSVAALSVKTGQRSVRRRSAVPKLEIIFLLKMPSNDDDRRQWRKQGGVVGAAASKTQVPSKARCGCWVPQPVRRGGHSKSSCGYLRSRQPCSTAAGCFPPAGRGRQGRAPSAGQGRRPARRLPAGTPLPRRQDSPASCPENRR